jgi:hypothetical protein
MDSKGGADFTGGVELDADHAFAEEVIWLRLHNDASIQNISQGSHYAGIFWQAVGARIG